MPTQTELDARVRLDRALNNTTLLSTANLATLLNEGALQMAKDGDAFIKSATWTGVASAQTYVLGGASPKVTGFLDIYWPAGGLIYTQSSGVTKTSPTHFQVVSESWLDLHLPGWRDASASNGLQYAYLSYDGDGNLVLGVYPKTSNTTPSFKLYYKARGTDMTASSSNYPWTNSTTNLHHTEPYQVGIAFYAAWRAHELFTHNEALAKYYRTLYYEKAAELREAQRKAFAAEVEGQRSAVHQAALWEVGSL